MVVRETVLDSLVEEKSNPRDTGTYRCGYMNQSLEHLNTWIHLYVKGKATPPERVSAASREEEGSEVLYVVKVCENNS